MLTDRESPWTTVLCGRGRPPILMSPSTSTYSASSGRAATALAMASWVAARMPCSSMYLESAAPTPYRPWMRIRLSSIPLCMGVSCLESLIPLMRNLRPWG